MLPKSNLETIDLVGNNLTRGGKSMQNLYKLIKILPSTKITCLRLTNYGEHVSSRANWALWRVSRKGIEIDTVRSPFETYFGGWDWPWD